MKYILDSIRHLVPWRAHNLLYNLINYIKEDESIILATIISYIQIKTVISPSSNGINIVILVKKRKGRIGAFCNIAHALEANSN